MNNRRAQIFIMTLLVMFIALSLGAAFLFYSRSFRNITRVQVDTDRAYSMAVSGMERGINWAETDACASWTVNWTIKNLWNDAFYVELRKTNQTVGNTNIATVNIGSLGSSGRSRRILTKSITVPVSGWARSYIVPYTPDIRMRLTSDGGYIIGGGYQEYRLIKTDSDGNIQWSARYAGSGAFSTTAFSNTDASASLQTSSLWQNADRTYIIGSNQVYTGPTSDFLLVKTNSTGNLLWTVDYDSRVGAAPGAIDKLYTVSEISEGLNKFYIAGGLGMIGDGQFFMIKADTNWSVGPAGTWARHYGIIDPSLFYKDTLKVIRQTPGNGYILGGESSFLGAIPEFMLVKINATGTTEWAYGYEYFTVEENYFEDILALNDGYIFGGSWTTFPVMFVIRTNALGRVGSAFTGTWARFYPCSGGIGCWSHMNSLAQTNDGGFILGGYYAVTGRSYALLLRIRSDGTIVWARRYGTGGSSFGDQITSVYITGDGGYISGGRINDNYTLVKTDSSGKPACCTISSDVTSSFSVNDVTNDTDFHTWTVHTNTYWSTGPVSPRVNTTAISSTSTSVNFSVICP